MVKLPDNFSSYAGHFALIRARRFIKELTPVCGSPIEVYLATVLRVSLEGMQQRVDFVYTDEEQAAAPNFFLRPQFHIGRHRVDFLIGDKTGSHAVIECDGREFHHSSREQIERDRKRDADLVAAGYKVLRYPGIQIMSDEWSVVIDVLTEVFPVWSRAWWEEHREFLV